MPFYSCRFYQFIKKYDFIEYKSDFYNEKKGFIGYKNDFYDKKKRFIGYNGTLHFGNIHKILEDKIC